MNKLRKILACLLVTAVFVMPISAVNSEVKGIDVRDALAVTAKLNGGWIQHFEGTSWGHSIIQTSDGGYLVAGGTGYNSGCDALLIKTDAEGNQQWETTFGDSSGWDAFEGLVETSDGGFVASGIKALKGFLAKVDADGNSLWEKTYGGTINGYCIDVRETADEGFIITGVLWSEPYRSWLIKTDIEGNEVWSKTYGEDYPVTFHSVRMTADGGFILSGWEERSEISPTSWAVKTDGQGNVEWENFYESCDAFYSGMQTSDGGYIFTGSYTISPTFRFDQICVFKTDSEGSEVWSKTFGTQFFAETSFWVEETREGSYVIIGNYLGIGTTINLALTGVFFPFFSKIWLLKLDSDGNLIWDNKVETGFGRCIKQTDDGGFIVTGQKGAYNFPKGILLIKTDENGDTC